jgi:spore germination protein YaaH/peptidoglycan/xylan/chitin deacetylase (PgdA/CDA1 family)
VALALAAIVLGSAFLFSFLEIPVNAPIAGLFGAHRESGRNAEIAIPNRSVPVSPVLLDRYRKEALLAIDRADAARIKPPPADESSKVVIGFYASWQTAGLSSLRSHADKLTHLMPEWLQLNQAGDGLDLYEYDLSVAPQNVEVRQIAAKEGLQVWPILNNHDGTKFDPDRVHRLLAQKPAGQQKFAEVLRDWLLQEGCEGINLDFESLKPADYSRLATFVPLLAKVLHAAHLSVSIDLEVGQLKAKWLPPLASACDLLIVMAYDQHSEEDAPGPVAALDWSTKVLVDSIKVIPRSKLVLGIGAFGYDWTVGKRQAQDINYQQAMLLARDYGPNDGSGRAIRFDADSLNPRLEYFDEQGKNHKVWFLDGVTAFNQWSLAQKAGIRGAAVWMLGSEDPSIWSVLGKSALFAPPRLDALEKINFPYEIEFVGEGEILSVHAEPGIGQRKLTPDLASGLCIASEYTQLPSCYIIQRRGFHPTKVALTFDDGPSAEYTPEILDELKRLQVPATFFICGNNAERFPQLIQREWREGHEIGNHTFSHPNLAAVSRDRAVIEITSTKRALQSILGRSTLWFRAPYHADAEPTTADEVGPLVIATQLGYAAVGELIDPRDWDLWNVDAAGHRVRRTPEEIARAGLDQVGVVKGNTILLHDAGGDRSATAKALEIMVPELKKRGFEFVRISDLAGITRDEAMPPLSPSEAVINRINAIVFGTIFSILHFLGIAFVAAIGLGIARVIFVTILALIYHFRTRKTTAPADFQPLVSVIVPAFNECKVVGRTIRSVLDGDYQNIEIIFVDDGSTDGTADAVDAEFAAHPKVRVIRQSNGGKASALNNGIGQSSGEIIVGLDADTQFGTETISSLIAHFTNPRVGAVAGNVKVGNVINILTRWQAVEYITSQNVDRLAYTVLNAVTVVPGAVGAWRRQAMDEAGGYLTDTLAEDMDLTWRLRRKGWKIETENRAVAYTEAPAVVGQFFKQR